MTQIEIDQNMILELANAGVIYGHKKSKTHPKMRAFIGAQRNEIEILKPELVMRRLDKAVEFLKEKKKNGAVFLIVGTSVSAHEAVDTFAEAFGFPYVKTRWLGGTLTNWGMLKERLKYYLDLKEKREKGDLAKYTKKEQVDFTKELEKLRIKFEGLKNLKKIPDVLFVIDPKTHETEIREEKRV
ncbi:MAG: 30S ribosomal protein S2, partial [Nanoarchaeota archaeon]|nr:30S ribosomal protein S2 [Nanoarchaeota archaeon]